MSNRGDNYLLAAVEAALPPAVAAAVMRRLTAELGGWKIVAGGTPAANILWATIRACLAEHMAAAAAEKAVQQIQFKVKDGQIYAPSLGGTPRGDNRLRQAMKTVFGKQRGAGGDYVYKDVLRELARRCGGLHITAPATRTPAMDRFWSELQTAMARHGVRGRRATEAMLAVERTMRGHDYIIPAEKMKPVAAGEHHEVLPSTAPLFDR